MFRMLVGVFAIAVALAAATNVASAATSPYSAKYGTLPLGSPHGHSSAGECELLASGQLAVTAERLPAWYVNLSHPDRLATKIITPNGKRRGRAVRGWVDAKVPKRHIVLDRDFNPSGGFAYVSRPISNKSASEFVVGVRSANGSAARFGNRGRVAFTLATSATRPANLSASVLLQRDGAVVVAVSRVDGISYLHFDRNGKQIKWGTGGVLKTEPFPAVTWFISAAEEIPMLEAQNGDLLLSGRLATTQSANPVPFSLFRVRSNGMPVSAFGTGGAWHPPIEGAVTTTTLPAQVFTVRAAGSGFIVVYGNGSSAEFGSSYSLRVATLDANGKTVATSSVIDSAISGGDGGFPDARPFNFRATSRGFAYLASEQFFSGALVATWGKSAIGDRVPTTVTGSAGYIAADYTITPNGRAAYACGAANVGRGKLAASWKRYRPAIRSVTLP